jgi:hypothetical protein
MSDWVRVVRAQLVAESGARHELVDCVAGCMARFVAYPPRGAARYTLAVRLHTAPSTVYVLAEHVMRHAHEYEIVWRRLPGLAPDIVLMRGEARALDALRLLAALPRMRCVCARCTARRRRRAALGTLHTQLHQSAPAA